MYMTQRKKDAKARGSQPPSVILERTADMYRSSIDPKTRGKHRAMYTFVCHIRSITRVTNVVLTIITPTSAIPAQIINLFKASECERLKWSFTNSL